MLFNFISFQKYDVQDVTNIIYDMNIMQYTKNSVLCEYAKKQFVQNIPKYVLNIPARILCNSWKKCVTVGLSLSGLQTTEYCGGGFLLDQYNSHKYIKYITMISVKTETLPFILISLSVNISSRCYLKNGLYMHFLTLHHCN